MHVARQSTSDRSIFIFKLTSILAKIKCDIYLIHTDIGFISHYIYTCLLVVGASRDIHLIVVSADHDRSIVKDFQMKGYFFSRRIHGSYHNC